MNIFCIGVMLASASTSLWLQMGILFGSSSSSTTRLLNPDTMDEAEQTSPVNHLSHSVRFGHRPLVPRDEFVFKTASASVVDEYFRFDPSWWNNDNVQVLQNHVRQTSLRPLWACHGNQNRNSSKVVYVQMFRSGGSMLRALLKAYANVCGAGIAIVSQCIDLGYATLAASNGETANWVNGASKSPHYMAECQLVSLHERNGQSLPLRPLASSPMGEESNPVSHRLLQQHAVDVLAGYLPLGSAIFWNDATTDKPVNARYIVMLRDPLSRFVSQFLLVPLHKKNSGGGASNNSYSAVVDAAKILDDIHHHMRTRLKRNKPQEKLSNVLITPEQRFWAERESVSWTLARQVNLSKTNLVRQNVVVGILERLPQSLRLIQHVLDGNKELSKAFDMFSSTKHTDAIPNLNTKQSRERTRAVVEAIHANTTLKELADQFLQYEYEIYRFALHLNAVQYGVVVKQQQQGSLDSTM